MIIVACGLLARRWALKEAVLKACGSWRLPFPEMRLEAGCSIEVVPEGRSMRLAAEIRRTGKGPHVVVFDGASALLVADQRLEVRSGCARTEDRPLRAPLTFVAQVSASLSHDDDTAFAVALCHRREAPA